MLIEHSLPREVKKVVDDIYEAAQEGGTPPSEASMLILQQAYPSVQKRAALIVRTKESMKHAVSPDKLKV